MDKYVKAVESEDMNQYSQVVAHDPDIVLIGSGVGERMVGWEALKQAMQAQFDAVADTKITVSDVTITVPKDSSVAWATSMWIFNAKIGDQAIEVPLRCSWVLEKRDGAWLIVHFHKSVGQQ